MANDHQASMGISDSGNCAGNLKGTELYQLSDTLTDWIVETIGESVSRVDINNQGWTNLVLEINGRWMARLPKPLSDDAGHALTSRYTLEKQLLDTLTASIGRDGSNNLSSSVLPKVYLAPDNLEVCMLYPKLAGNPIDWQSEQMNVSGAKAYTPLAGALGALLAKLHTTKMAHPQLVAYPYGDEDFLGDVLPALHPLVSDETYNNAYRYFSTVLDTLNSQSKVSVSLCHGDFGPANILLGSDFRLSAVLDFSDVCLGDAAMDFAPLWRRSPSQFMHDLLATYREVSGEDHWQSLQSQTLNNRIQFHALRKAVFVVWYGKGYGFDNGITGSLNYLKQYFTPGHP
ncbi:aminoglycoside phosphotransferase family protein [Shewanella litorisediminis]|uniref:Phosphotransferase n=1 Tax=Shewanella litorisediminis TaxID=1173586 RepID=A0ABX7FZ48_9GAMM|nr:aminoglycoside phosphotransferase family protein [Shewanella litorisediminis]MCL2918718.1 aminoglycoside phosphotransferase family protein [Shewanella litorisediminis]QRH00309.1 phosphotransferase [Shewanella litorisediminis]